MKLKNYLVVHCLMLLAIGACSSPTNKTAGSEDNNGEGNENGWQLLIQDDSTKGWHTYLGDEVVGWEVVDGVLSTQGRNGDIVTDEEYENFELLVEWKIEEQGNSGVFYYVVESPGNKRMHETGPEFQIIDNDNYPQELTEQQKTGALSDVLAPHAAAGNPIGAWNLTKIVANEGAVEHWLNGEKILEYQLGSEDLAQEITASKFAELPYAKVRKGRIGLQDHGNPVYYKDIKIKKL